MSTTLDRSLVDLLLSVYLLDAPDTLRDSALQVIRLVRTVRPEVPEGVVAEAASLLKWKRVVEARAMLEDLDAKGPPNALVKAMLALAHCLQESPQCELYAGEARALAPGKHNDNVLRVLDLIDTLTTISRDPYWTPPEEPGGEAVAEVKHGIAC